MIAIVILEHNPVFLTFVTSHHFDVLGNHIELTVPTHELVTFARRVSRSHRGRVILHPNGIANRGFIVIHKGHRVQNLRRIVLSRIFGIGRYNSNVRRPALKRILVCCRRGTLHILRRYHSCTVNQRISLEFFAIEVLEYNPELELFIDGLHFNVLGNHVELAVPTHECVAFTRRVCRCYSRIAIFHPNGIAYLDVVIINKCNRVLVFG